MSEVVHSETTGLGGPGKPIKFGTKDTPMLQDEQGRILSPLSWEDRDARDCEVARLLAMGFSRGQVAKQMNLNEAHVQVLFKKIRQGWIETKFTKFEEYLAIEVAKIDLVEQEAWGAWLRSIAGGEVEFKRQWKCGIPRSKSFQLTAKSKKKPGRPKTRKTDAEAAAMLAAEKGESVDDPPPEIDFDSRKPPSNATVIKMLREKSGIGDPQWLEIVLKCSERRARLLGMDAPARLVHETGHADVSDASRSAIVSAIPRLLEFEARLNERLGIKGAPETIEVSADGVDVAGAADQPA